MGMFDDLVPSAPAGTSAGLPPPVPTGSGMGMFDDLVPPPSTAKPSRLDELASAATDIPHKIYEAGSSAVGAMNDAFNPYSAAQAAKMERIKNSSFLGGLGEQVKSVGDVGSGLLAVPSFVASPIAGTARSVIGHTFNAANPLSPGDVGYVSGDEAADTAMMGLQPARGGIKPPTPTPSPPVEPEFGVTLSQGQETGDLAAIRLEQAALRDQLGPQALKNAQDFREQQQGQLEAAKEGVAAKLDAFQQNIVKSPQEAGDVVSSALSKQEQLRKDFIAQEAAALTPPKTVAPLDAADTVADALRGSADTTATRQQQNAARLQAAHEDIRSGLSPDNTVLAQSPQEASEIISGAVTRAEEQAREARDAAYASFREMPGQFDPKAFRGIGNDIRKSLNVGDDPVTLNNKTTPMAVAAVQDMDRTLGAAAKNALDPNVPSYKPFTPSAVDDVRKRLMSFQRQANSAANATRDYSDVRAMGRIVDGFDDVVQNALQSPKTFTGDGDAVASAIQNARGLHSELRNTFSRQGSGDKVGPIMQQIVGQREGQAAPANQIAQWLYGTGQTPVLVARRMLSVFGPQSPEVGALKQGLWSYITERPEGVTAWGPKQQADRIYDFLNGKGRSLSQEYLSPTEQAQWRAHADDLRSSVTPPPAPTDIVARALSKINGVGGQGATSAELADTLFGRSGTGENPLGVKLAQHVKDTYGPDSDAFKAIQQGMLSRLTRSESGRLGFDPEAISDQIGEYLNGRGKPMADVLHSPQDQANLKNYADALREHAERIGTPKDEVDRAIAKISGRDGTPATPTEVSDLLHGRSGAGDQGISARLVERLKTQFGESSPYFSAIKQGTFRKLVEPAEGKDAFGPKKVADRLDEFLNGSGKPVADAMLTDPDKEMIRAYSAMMRKLVVPQAGAQWSNNPWMKAVGSIGKMIGAVIGHAVLPGVPVVPEIVGMGLGASAASKIGAISQARNARQIARQMPLVAAQLQRYQRAVDAVNKANSAPSRTAEAVAALNLSRSLSPLGINLGKLAAQGPGTAYGESDQKNIPRPPSQKKDSDKIDQQQRAFGGMVQSDNPESADKPEVQKKSDWAVPQVEISPNDGPLGDNFGHRGDERKHRSTTDGSGGQNAAGGAVVARAAGGGVDYVPPQTNYDAANHALKLTPQEQALYQRHLQNLYGDGGVDNPDGSRSSLYQAVQEHNGKFYNIPTVWDGKRETQPWTNPDTGKTMDVPNDTALSNVNKAGWDSFPSYDTSGVADDRYDQMHGYMEKDTDSYLTPGRARGGRVEPKNINHNPSPAQASSGNYKKDHVNVLGLNITIENAKGKPRHGVGRDGKPWSAILGAHYGYFKRSEARDGDNVDCYLGPHIKSPHVFVIDQIDHETGKYDEAKCCVGFANEKQALRAYEAGFSDGKGKDRIGKVTAMTIQQFKDWLKHGNTKAPFNHAKREIA